MMEAIADPAFLVCAVAVLAGAFIQGTGGLGFAMFAAPVAALLHPELVPGPMLMLGGTVSLLAATREPASIDFRFAGIALAGRVTGSLVAGLVIGLAPRSVFAVAFAILILALSTRLVNHIDGKIVRLIVLGVSAVSAVILLVQNLKGA